MVRRRSIVVLLGIVVGLLVLLATPADACTCRAELVADALAQSDAAFVGVFMGHEVPPGGRAISHFEVEHTVKGDLGRLVAVESEGSGAACGLLELQVGKRTGLFLGRTGTGWRSSLCHQTDPAGLLSVAQAAAGDSAPESPVRSLVLPAGVLAVAVAGYFVVDRVRRRQA